MNRLCETALGVPKVYFTPWHSHRYFTKRLQPEPSSSVTVNRTQRS